MLSCIAAGAAWNFKSLWVEFIWCVVLRARTALQITRLQYYGVLLVLCAYALRPSLTEFGAVQGILQFFCVDVCCRYFESFSMRVHHCPVVLVLLLCWRLCLC